MRLYRMADPERFSQMRTEEVRRTFLVSDLFAAGELRLALTDLDRAVVGGVVPGAEPLILPVPAELRAEYFLQRRELGVLNTGGRGSVVVDGTEYAMERLDVLYVGRGAREVRFSSADAGSAASFYLLSYPAHAAYPTTLARGAELSGLKLGSFETCNARTIYKAIHAEGIKSCQLVMGYTVLEAGSNWNTMPPHTHDRRSEIYFYFDLGAEARVVHLMGAPEETRHLFVGDREVVLSPGWSIHCGVGTVRYAFCWGMGGENQDYADMDPAPVGMLR